MPVETNANSDALAQVLKQARKGTFTGLITQKKGVVRGRKPNKLVYGDDVVHVVVITGFKYPSLVARSLAKLTSGDIDPEFVLRVIQDKKLRDGKGMPITLVDVRTAIEALKKSFDHTLSDAPSKSTTAHVYDPLMVDGEAVRGCRVYKCVRENPDHDCHCRHCTEDPKAPLPGTIYLQGLKIGERVLEPAKNGPVPPSKSRGDVVAKKIIRNMLPVGRYVSYTLEPGTNFFLRVGGQAEVAAMRDKVHVNPTVADLVLSEIQAQNS